MDAPPGKEDPTPFVNISRHLKSLQSRVPQIFAVDEVNGFVLLEDLGDATFTRLLDQRHDEAELYQYAIEALCQ